MGGQIYELGVQRDGLSAIDPRSSSGYDTSWGIQSFKDPFVFPKLSGSLISYGCTMVFLAASFLSAIAKDPNRQQPSTSFAISDYQAPTNVVMKTPELPISVPPIPSHWTSSQTELLNTDRID